MFRDRHSVRVGVVVVLAVLVAGTLSSYFGARALFMPAPPMLDRVGRAIAIFLVPGMHFLAPALLMVALRSIPFKWSRSTQACAIVLAGGLAIALSSLASVMAFGLLHLACYTWHMCATSTVPESALRAVFVTGQPFVPTAIGIGIVVAVGLWARAQSRPVA